MGTYSWDPCAFANTYQYEGWRANPSSVVNQAKL